MSDQKPNINKSQPRELYILFFAELWERFSFYGMRALLTLYMVKELMYGEDQAYGVYGAYGALVYATPVLGGLIADKLVGFRRAIMLGAVLMALGHFAMAIEHEIFFYSALALLIIGNGFFKPNISSLVGELYEKDDPRRDGGFTIFYMGINIGAFLAPLLCGTIGEVYGWHYGFGLAGIGMLLGLLVFWKGQNRFGDKGKPPDRNLLFNKGFLGMNWNMIVIIGSFLVIPIFAILVNQNQLMSILLSIVGVVIVGIILYMAFKYEKAEGQRILVILVLTFFNMIFWAFFEQAGSSLTLFTDKNVDRMFFGWEIPASVFQSVNPFFIIILAPLFSMLWISLSKKKLEPFTPVKFSFGLIQLGLGFGALVVGSWFAGGNFLVPVAFLFLSYFLQTTGELSLSPVGLSMITKLSPAKLVGFFMGTWFLSTSFSHHIAGIIAKFTAVSEAASGPAGEALNRSATLVAYIGVFENIAIIAIASGILLLILVPLLRKWMHGIH